MFTAFYPTERDKREVVAEFFRFIDNSEQSKRLKPFGLDKQLICEHNLYRLPPNHRQSVKFTYRWAPKEGPYERVLDDWELAQRNAGEPSPVCFDDCRESIGFDEETEAIYDCIFRSTKRGERIYKWLESISDMGSADMPGLILKQERKLERSASTNEQSSIKATRDARAAVEANDRNDASLETAKGKDFVMS